MDGNASEGEGVNVDWTTDDELEILSVTAAPSQPIRTTPTGNGEASTSAGASRVNLINDLVGMGFSEKLVLKAIEENGEEDRFENILNTCLTYTTLEDSPQPQEQLSTNSDPSSSSGYNEAFPDELSDMDSLSEYEPEDNTDSLSEKHKMLLSMERTGSLTEKDEKLLALANMGYNLDEAEIAIERSPDSSVAELTEFIGVAQMARELDCYLPAEDPKPKRISFGSSSKKRKLNKKQDDTAEGPMIRLPIPMIGYGVPSQQPERIHRSLPEAARGPPYFYYENVALAPKGVWDTISRHLLEIEPEFVDSKYFSATARKRGYIHNLPIENRFPLIPLPPLTISQAFPLSKRWWPSWDTRDKMNCIQTAIGSARLTERIRMALEPYEGRDPPEHVQKYVMDQCRKWNLVWVGRNKVAPLEPDEVEMLLGFPKNHTRGGGISRTDRYKSLGNSFQVDTVAYHLSVLKDLFPNGINMLSLFSGIGGAEVALHRLGVKLKNVVSVEKSKGNRDIVRSWWEQTNQTGSLYDFDDVKAMDAQRLEDLMDMIGGFDLIVGGSPCNNLAGSNRVSRDGLEGTESSLFFEYVRILEVVRDLTNSRKL